MKEIDYSKHFISTHHWEVERLERVLQKADELRTSPYSQVLHQKLLAMVFFNPSLRTRSSMMAAMAQLGGSAYELAVGSTSWKLEHRKGAVMDADKTEHIKDAASALSNYCDSLGVRAFAELKDWEAESAEPILTSFARYSKVPIINLESALYHPCQAMADVMAMAKKAGGVRKLRGKKFVMSWVYHPKATPLAVNFSSALAAAQFGMDVTVAHPAGFEWGTKLMGMMDKEVKKGGGSLSVETDFEAGISDSDFIYAKSYMPPSAYGKPEVDALARAKHKDWKVTQGLLTQHAPSSSLMHCMPLRRNVEIEDAAVDGKQSLIYQQAENRLHAQKAILLELMNSDKKQ